MLKAEKIPFAILTVLLEDHLIDTLANIGYESDYTISQI